MLVHDGSFKSEVYREEDYGFNLPDDPGDDEYWGSLGRYDPLAPGYGTRLARRKFQMSYFDLMKEMEPFNLLTIPIQDTEAFYLDMMEACRSADDLQQAKENVREKMRHRREELEKAMDNLASKMSFNTNRPLSDENLEKQMRWRMVLRHLSYENLLGFANTFVPRSEDAWVDADGKVRSPDIDWLAARDARDAERAAHRETMKRKRKEERDERKRQKLERQEMEQNGKGEGVHQPVDGTNPNVRQEGLHNAHTIPHSSGATGGEAGSNSGRTPESQIPALPTPPSSEKGPEITIDTFNATPSTISQHQTGSDMSSTESLQRPGMENRKRKRDPETYSEPDVKRQKSVEEAVKHPQSTPITLSEAEIPEALRPRQKGQKKAGKPRTSSRNGRINKAVPATQRRSPRIANRVKGARRN